MSGKVQALKSGVKGFANAVKRLAIKDKKMAEELVYMHGIRSEITPNALKTITKDMFDSTGKMTDVGRKEVQGLLERFKLPQNATWDDILQAVRKSKEETAAKLKKLIDNIPKKSKVIKVPDEVVMAEAKTYKPKTEFQNTFLKDFRGTVDKFKKFQKVKPEGLNFNPKTGMFE